MAKAKFAIYGREALGLIRPEAGGPDSWFHSGSQGASTPAETSNSEQLAARQQTPGIQSLSTHPINRRRYRYRFFTGSPFHAASTSTRVNVSQLNRQWGRDSLEANKHAINMAMVEHAYHFPLELCWRIIHLLGEERGYESLARTAAVCRGWRNESLRFLRGVQFATAEDIPDMPDVALEDIADKPLRLWRGPQYVSIFGNKDERNGIEHLGVFASKLAGRWTHIAQLGIESAEWREPDLNADVVLRNLSGFSSITSLMLNNVKFPTVITFRRFVCTFPYLESLQLDGVEVVQNPFDPRTVSQFRVLPGATLPLLTLGRMWLEDSSAAKPSHSCIQLLEFVAASEGFIANTSSNACSIHHKPLWGAVRKLILYDITFPTVSTLARVLCALPALETLRLFQAAPVITDGIVLRMRWPTCNEFSDEAEAAPAIIVNGIQQVVRGSTVKDDAPTIQCSDISSEAKDHEAMHDHPAANGSASSSASSFSNLWVNVQRSPPTCYADAQPPIEPGCTIPFWNMAESDCLDTEYNRDTLGAEREENAMQREMLVQPPPLLNATESEMQLFHGPAALAVTPGSMMSLRPPSLKVRVLDENAFLADQSLPARCIQEDPLLFRLYPVTFEQTQRSAYPWLSDILRIGRSVERLVVVQCGLIRREGFTDLSYRTTLPGADIHALLSSPTGLRQSDKCIGRRKPAWTDRILHMESAMSTVGPLSYTSHPEITVSDHKPVSAVLDIRAPSVDWQAYDAFAHGEKGRHDRIF
ncbi:predicted protein [Postia placenta Mad-698-R]|nr:predicted protein [Postia placenta Mad-698-R]